MMKRKAAMMVLAIFLCSVFAVTSLAGGAGAGIADSIDAAMEELGVEKGDPNLCVLTDATYVKVEGQTTEEYVDIIQEETGCSIGKGNLLLFHRPITYPLKIALFDKATKDCVVLTHKDGTTTSVKINIDGDKATDPEYWKKLEEALGQSDAFSIVTIANSWAKGVPYDFLNACEFHNHLCPGITSGYFIAGYIQKNYPLQKGEKYIWIACPPWCKDDVIQMLFDLTPGKRSCFVKELSVEQKTALRTNAGDVAGILVIWNDKESKGKGVVFRFDWIKACEVSDVKRSDFKPEGGKSNPVFWTTRVKCNWGLMPYLDQPEMLINVAKEFEVTPEMLVKFEMAGVNPYVEIGMLEEEKKGEEVPVIPCIAVIAAIAIAGALVYATRRKKRG